VQNNLLFITNPIQTRDFMLDGPYTKYLAKVLPGFIGQFVGWQIVNKWMSAHEETTLPQLLKRS
jgi:hypothetical protein